MVVTKRNPIRCELRIEDMKIKQGRKIKYVCGVLADYGKCDTEMPRDIKGITKKS